MTASDRAERFEEAALEALGVSVEAAAGRLRHVPSSGKAVIAANHPHGLVDGLIMLALLRRVRPDIKVMANSLLSVLPELCNRLILVDPYHGAGAADRNRAPLRQALEWLGQGGALVVFPAGDVAHLRLLRAGVVESPWNTIAVRLARKAKAPLIPAFIEGRNSWAFQLFGLLHQRVRTAMLPRELLNKKKRTIRVAFGSPVTLPAETSRNCAAQFTDYVRLRAILLRRTLWADPNQIEQRPASRTGSALSSPPNSGLEPIAPPENRERLRQEVEGLSEFELLRCGAMRVFCCPAQMIPVTLREIGRAREIAFRGVGEGSGHSLDLDEFDRLYLHLFLWDEAGSQIAGAYRLGLTDEILEKAGLRGLYTRTLFRYGAALLRELGLAIELGRSFVAAEYQRSYGALHLLWKGLAKFVRLHPRYRVLFGAVSISAEYDSMTKRLLMAFLRQNHFDPALSRLVRPTHPPRIKPVPAADLNALSSVVHSIDEADDLVREIEQGRRGIPVLVRHYLRLEAKLLGFNIDPNFGNVLDGLFYVDLDSVDRRVLSRYMGADETAEFLLRGADNPVKPV